MNAYLVVSHFKESIEGKLIAETMPKHHAYFQKVLEEGHIFLAGPHVWEDGSVGKGGVMLLKTDSMEEAEDIMQHDPLVMGGIEEYTISPFKVVKVRPELENWLNG